jgi:hypothetical protein
LIVSLALLGTFSMAVGGWIHNDRIGRYDEADSVARATFDADIALAASMTLFGLACVVSAWMAFRARRLDAEEWAGASQTAREILAGLALYVGALFLTSFVPDGDAATLLSEIGNGLPVFLAVGVWILILGPGKSSYVRARRLTPTYMLSTEGVGVRTTGTTVAILRPVVYALAFLVLIVANVIAAIYFSSDQVLSTEFFLINISQSQLLVVAVLFLAGLDCLHLAVVWRIRRSSAANTFDLLTTVRPLIFVNSILLFTEWYNLFVVPVFSVAASAVAVAVVTAVGPGLFLAWCGPTLTQVIDISRRDRQGSGGEPPAPNFPLLETDPD